MKICVVLGAQPEIIKMLLVLRECTHKHSVLGRFFVW